jgi:hypothetical protein
MGHLEEGGGSGRHIAKGAHAHPHWSKCGEVTNIFPLPPVLAPYSRGETDRLCGICGCHTATHKTGNLIRQDSSSSCSMQYLATTILVI